MLKWVQGSVSALTGAAEPIYGAEAFHPITETVSGQNPYGKLDKSDLEWRAPWSSNVETQTFYFSNTATGHYGFFQVIHSNPVGLHFTAQFTCLIRHDDKPEESVWTSTHLEDFEAKGTTMTAQGLSITLNEAENEYAVTSVVNEESLVEVTFSRGECAGFKIGADGTSYYGEDVKSPWGSMRHVFWPRAGLKGKIVVKGHTIELEPATARGMYVMAMQGMKPHHAASRWNFLNFQGPTMSCVVMEFTTPPSYGSQTVSIGAITKDDELIATSVAVKVEHQDSEVDEVGWSAPKKIKFEVAGPKVESETDAAEVSAVVEGSLDRLVDRVDVMAEIPSFVKKVVAGVSGAKPYIYQYSNPMTMTLEIDGEKFTEEGHAFSEATFIS
ncbi:ceramide-binding protein Svf1p [Trichomonascus vanleenenianus]|uniref:Svf1p n=1 Tax=Trichomonascus vanleenenianus TaxID=2268995 RepID=UPI003ECA1ACD